MLSLLLILAEHQEVIFPVFRIFLRTGGNRSSLLNRLCYLANFNHFHQITQSEKMLITATRWNHSLTLLEWNRKLRPLASLQQFDTEEQLP